ncbi:MAG TPA: HAMP domain-containing sensor histidine kinase, partial [Leptospiraceae bacterium]|nr:HAMP domain-containing sensor histidine kinase [Leptospiraceae bacterium]
HEIKTPLASLRLQAESLQDSLKNKRDKILAERLIRNTERLELQMENAIFLSSLDRKNHLYIENINIYNFFQSLSFGYREVRIQAEQESSVRADRRALEIIFRNSIENSIQHGKASEVILGCQTEKGRTVLFIEDNGLGFQGDWKRLGQLFYRHRSGSGTGIGIYIMKILAKKIQSDIYFIRKEKGFRTEVVFQ